MCACYLLTSEMAHRGRSKTADSAESKKTKGQPRRLTEKIAIMRKKEHEQSEAFEQAMKSIFEVGAAKLSFLVWYSCFPHPGLGSDLVSFGPGNVAGGLEGVVCGGSGGRGVYIPYLFVCCMFTVVVQFVTNISLEEV